MLKIIKNICYIFLLFLILLPNRVMAYQNDDYYISRYDVKIIVNEDNTFDITETIIANFIVPSME